MSAPPQAAPLISADGAWVAPSGRAEWFAGAGGLRLRAALFPAEHPVGSVVLSGGRTEFIEKYLEVIGELVVRGFTVLTHDWRGQGLSQRLVGDRLKGCADGFDDFISDHGALLTTFEDRLPRPWIAVSHSMGACLTLTAIAQGETRFSAAVLSAPMLGLKVGRSPLAALLAKVMTGLGFGRRYLGWPPPHPLAADFEANRLTHDSERYARCQALLRACPDLALGGVTWGWLNSAFDAIAWLRRAPALEHLKAPITLVAAECDTLVDNAAVEAIARRLPNGRYRLVPGARHELMMETDEIRGVFLEEFDMLAGTLAPQSGERAG